MMNRRYMWIAVGLLAGGAAGVQAQHTEHTSGDVPLYDNLGSHSYGITTRVPRAQQYFDQGLRLYYAFNHAEAIRAFRAAAEADHQCAMCWWGEALSYGPNINLPMDSAAGVAAYTAIREAQVRSSYASPRERALIDALAARYAEVPPADRAPLDSAYARAMADVAAAYPDDPEAMTLYAEAIMDLSPWNYWEADGSPRPQTGAALAALESVTSRWPDHPGANHFYIHAVEAVDPERAVQAAERLAGLMPGAGHLVHMPGHIYVRVGRYRDAITANEHAVHADETYIRDQNPAFGVYVAGYYPHNYDFLAFAASMIGRQEQAIGSADRMKELQPQEMLGAPGMTFMQHHRTRRLQMRVRFGEWQEILAEPAPPAELKHARAMWHYAHGRAAAATGDFAAAEADLSAVRAAATDPALVEERLEFNTAGDVLAIASDVLAGQIAAARRDYDAAIMHLRNAAEAERALTYGEPPDWSIPVNQELGAVLLAAGRPAEAQRAFESDLEFFPENGWSLHGLASALRAQGRTSEAAGVQARFERIWEGGPIDLAGR
ncbi:MAG: hypothetical protein ACYC28_04595 [Longimicrobiales bacterium]